MDNEAPILDNGIMFSVYDTGPWIGVKLPGNSRWTRICLAFDWSHYVVLVSKDHTWRTGINHKIESGT